MEILVGVAFAVGIVAGFLLKVLLGRRTNYGGTILVTKTQGKTLYLLELNDYPERIEFRKHVLFKVSTSEADLDRN